MQRVKLGDGQLCAGGEVGDSCAGDSGSALMLEVMSASPHYHIITWSLSPGDDP